MSDPIEITTDYLFAEIGRLYVENKLLRENAANQAAAEAEPPSPPEEAP